MTPEEFRNAITKRISRPDSEDDSDRLFGLSKDHIVFDNEEGTSPGLGSWINVTARHGQRQQETLGVVNGKRHYRVPGTLFIQVYTPEGIGMQTADRISRAAADLFDSVNVQMDGTNASNGSGDVINFQPTTTREIGPNGKWYQMLVECPFAYDDRK